MTNHPAPLRLWCTDPAAAARACCALHPQAAQRSIAIADDVCENRFTFRDHWEMERTHVPVQFGAAESDIDWAHIPAGDPEWLYAMNRHTCFVNLGKAWRYTGNSKYAEKYARLIDDWMARVPLTEASSSNTWRSLEAGLRCESWLRALRLFEGSGVLSPARRSAINECLRVHGQYLAEASGDFHKLSNWGVLQDHGLYLLGLALARPDWCELAARRLDENLHRSVMRDGSHWEQSPMYHCEVLHCALDTVLAARDNHRTLPQRLLDNTRKMCLALTAWIKPDGRLVCQSDSDDTDARDIIAAGALLFGDGLLHSAAGQTLFEENLWDFGAEAQSDYAALPQDDAARCSTLLPDSGNVMLRGTQGGWVHMHCGCLGSGHGHADLLHIDAGIAGEDVLIDAGRYTYVNTPLRRELKLPAAHNTTRVDGMDFSTCLDSWGYGKLAVPIKGENVFTDVADYAEGAHLGYLSRGVFTQRKLVWLKTLGILVVFDLFRASLGSGAHELEQNFHLGAGKVKLDGQTLRWQGENASASLQMLGSGLDIRLGKAPYSLDYNALCEGDCLTVRRSMQRDAEFGWFVTVLSMQQGAPRPCDATLLPVRKLCAGTELNESQAQAVRIRCGAQEAVVLACHGEVISEVDLLCAGPYAGYGKCLVFTPENPLGHCLTW